MSVICTVILTNFRIILSSGVNNHSNEIPLFPVVGFCSKIYQTCPCAQASPPYNTTGVYHDNAIFLQPSTGVVARWLLIPATQGFVLVVLFLGGKGRATRLFSSSWLMTLKCLSPGGGGERLTASPLLSLDQHLSALSFGIDVSMLASADGQAS